MKFLRPIIGLVISLIFLYLTFRKTSWSELRGVFEGVNYSILFFATAFHSLSFFLRTFRWQRLLSKIKEISIKNLFPVLSIGYMANNTLPFRAGEITKAYVLGRREGVSKSSTLATIVVERIFDGLGLLFFILLLSLFISLPLNGWSNQITTVALIGFIFGTVGLYLILNFKAPTRKLFQIILKKFPTKLKDKVDNLLNYFIEGLEVIKVRKIVLEVFVISLLIWLVEASLFYFVALGFNIQISYLSILFLTCIVNIIIMIPSAPGYIGTFEFFVTEGMVLFGVPPALAASYSIGLHLALWLPITVLGAIFLSRLGFGLKIKEFEKR